MTARLALREPRDRGRMRLGQWHLPKASKDITLPSPLGRGFQPHRPYNLPVLDAGLVVDELPVIGDSFLGSILRLRCASALLRSLSHGDMGIGGSGRRAAVRELALAGQGRRRDQ